MQSITPGKWTPEVVISRHQALTSNVQNEATLTRALGALGYADKLRDLLWLQAAIHRSRSIRSSIRRRSRPTC
jgi:hypothetical protein